MYVVSREIKGFRLEMTEEFKDIKLEIKDFGLEMREGFRRVREGMDDLERHDMSMAEKIFRDCAGK